MFRGLIYYYATYCLVGALIAALATPLMRMLAFRIGAVDRGQGRRVHDGLVPRLGGGAIFLGLMAPLLFVMLRGARSAASGQLVAILLAATIIFAAGVIDDFHGAPVWKKLAAETAAALLIWSWGIRIEQLANPFGESLQLGWLSLPVTVLWVVVITNAINLVDGLDGLAAATGILIAVTLIVFTPSKDHLLILACMVLIGSLAGFLVHNFPPATIFMGDSGSLLVGFLLAALSIVASTKASAMAAMMLPILAFAHPLMEMVYAVARRYHRGLPLGQADKEHIHHKLLDMGLTKRTALFSLVGMNTVIATLAILMVQRQHKVGVLPLVLFVALIVAGLRLFGYIKMRGITGEFLRLFARNRRRRHQSYLLARVRSRAEQARDIGALSAALEELVKDAGCVSARLDVDLPGFASPAFIYGEQGRAELLVGIEVPVVVHDRRVGTFQIQRRAAAGAFVGADEIINVVSVAVSGFFGRQGAS